ncbi:MAG: hypothetical protein J6C11_02440 [Spirochaetaceae bacterium]|nr:hypothetical protein [Spirochaetaceae bacterium]
MIFSAVRPTKKFFSAVAATAAEALYQGFNGFYFYYYGNSSLVRGA